MNNEEKKIIADLYASRLAAEKPTHEIVGWGSKDSQELRFKILSEISEFQNASVLDVGSGLVDFYFYLKKNHLQPLEYLGVDISGPLVEKSRETLQNEPHARSLCLDIRQDSLNQMFDYVFCSGALNLKILDNWTHTEVMLRRMYELANRGVACNFLSTYVDFSHEKDFHHSPEKVFSFVKKFAKRVTLRHDYPLYEFTIYFYKN